MISWRFYLSLVARLDYCGVREIRIRIQLLTLILRCPHQHGSQSLWRTGRRRWWRPLLLLAAHRALPQADRTTGREEGAEEAQEHHPAPGEQGDGAQDHEAVGTFVSISLGIKLGSFSVSVPHRPFSGRGGRSSLCSTLLLDQESIGEQRDILKAIFIVISCTRVQQNKIYTIISSNG